MEGVEGVEGMEGYGRVCTTKSYFFLFHANFLRR